MNVVRDLRLGQVVDAWRVRAVRLGLLGTSLITVGALTPAYLPRKSPWWSLIRQAHLDNIVFRLAGTGVTLVGLGLLVAGWFSLRPWGAASSRERGPAAYHGVRHWAILAIWGLPFLAAPPIFSHDAYSYAAQGWLVHSHINPYQAGPGVLPGGYADQVAWVWRFTPAPYGPLSLQLQHLIVDLTGFHPYLSALFMRVPALIGVCLIGVLLPRIARLVGIDPALTAWFGTLNPVLVVDFIGGAHNDALMMGLVVLAVWIALRVRGGWWLGAAIVGVGAAIKQPAFLAAYPLPLLGRPWRTWHFRDVTIAALRALASSGIAIGSFVLVTLATGLGFGWYNAVGVPGLVVTVSPFTILGQSLQFSLGRFGVPDGLLIRWSRTVGLVVSVVLVLGLAVTRARRQPLTFLSWAYLAVAFCGPALHSWYMLWGGLLLPLSRPSPKVVRVAVWATLFLLSYAAVILSWRNGAIALGVAALVGYLWQSVLHDRLARWLQRSETVDAA